MCFKSDLQLEILFSRTLLSRENDQTSVKQALRSSSIGPSMCSIVDGVEPIVANALKVVETQLSFSFFVPLLRSASSLSLIRERENLHIYSSGCTPTGPLCRVSIVVGLHSRFREL